MLSRVSDLRAGENVFQNYRVVEGKSEPIGWFPLLVWVQSLGLKCGDSGGRPAAHSYPRKLTTTQTQGLERF